MESRNARYSLQNRPTQTPRRFRFFATLSASDTLHSATNPPARNSPTPHLKSASTTSLQTKDPRLALDLHTHRNHRITIVLSSSSRPLANPNLHAFHCSLNASKSPSELHYLQTPKPSSYHPSSPPLIINQSPFSHSPSDPSPALCTPSKILLPEPTQTPSLTTPAPNMPKPP